jgi:hypothetical protein
MNGKAGGVVIRADADPSGIVVDVVDAVRYRATQLGIDEVVNVNSFGLSLRSSLAAIVAEITH